MPIFNKLVRDKIPEIIESNGERAFTRFLNDEEYLAALIEKISEEQKELFDADSPAKKLEELADLQEIINAIAAQIGSIDELENIRAEKERKRGGFSNKIFLESTA